MKIGTKIIATNSEYATSVPNGTIMTVTHVFEDGDVEAAIDGVDGSNWYMLKGTFEEHTKGNTMKIGTKIIATNSGYDHVPNGTIMTVARVFNNGHVNAMIYGSGGSNWFMLKGTFEEYTPEMPYGHATMPDGRTVDLTANRVRVDLMDLDELEAMKDHGGPWECWYAACWNKAHHPNWTIDAVYRVAPEPVVRTLTFYATDTLKGFGITRGPNSKHSITLTIKDGDIIDTKTEKL